jgi:hypothetical protein
MEQLTAFITLMRALAPLLGQLIQTAEQLMPAGGNGAAKLELVRGWIDAAVKADATLSPLVSTAWPLVSASISGLVAVYKASGAFGSTAAAPATTSILPKS